jgi:transcriptional regulator with XRE-family HTH domain
MQSSEQTALRWKLRRVAAGLRQADVARECGLPTTRYSEIERGLRAATKLEEELIEAELPRLSIGLLDHESDGL